MAETDPVYEDDEDGVAELFARHVRAVEPDFVIAHLKPPDFRSLLTVDC
jgi:hypothetical protein